MRPDPRARSAGASFLEEDSNGWLVTFSDLVLQLFAFVLVAAVLGGGAGPIAAPRSPRAALRQVVSAPPLVEAPTRRGPDALSLARFEEPPVMTVSTAPAESAVLGAAAAVPGARSEPATESPARVAAAVVVPPRTGVTAAPARSLASELEAFVTAEGLEEVVHVAVKGGGVILSIGDTIGFASGSAELLPDTGAVLDAVRALVAARPDLVVEVSGHTDDRPLHAGPFRSNLDLSLARAARVAHALAADDPALTSRVFAAGYGDARPVAPNDGADGRARNRRVELRLVPGRDSVS
ncbi:MAG: OmpA family protein [Deltaproteobacteria bacterium]|nr:OmpA family protein [Deltaproteobacteria bacterium]